MYLIFLIDNIDLIGMIHDDVLGPIFKFDLYEFFGDEHVLLTLFFAGVLLYYAGRVNKVDRLKL